MGYGDVGALNPDSKIPTENIDAIARRGVVFTDAHATSSVSTPSRYSLLTGRYNWRSTMKQGVGGGYAGPLIAPERTTFAGILQRQGYTTACIGKWHLGWNWAGAERGNENIDYSQPITEGPTERGFDYFYGISASLDMAPYVYVENDRATMIPDRIEPDYKDDVIFWREGPISADFDHASVLENLTDRACAYIAEKAGGKQPFMLYIPLTAPHTPVMPSGEFLGKSGLGLYADFVMMVDSEVGRLLGAIKDAGVENNTMVVFAADNGCAPYIHPEELVAKGHYPSGGFRGYKSDIYEGGHRIPLLVKWPAKIKPHAVAQTVCLTDLTATFAAIAGYKLAQDEAEDSFDISKALFKTDYTEPLREATVHSSNDGSFAIRRGNWKLITVPHSGGWGYPTKKESKGLPAVQLYDMKYDPDETTNLYESRPDVVEMLFEMLTSYVENGRSTPGPILQNDPPHRWPQLNWINQR
jgi:arylsulfatase A-like enzyme